MVMVMVMVIVMVIVMVMAIVTLLPHTTTSHYYLHRSLAKSRCHTR